MVILTDSGILLRLFEPNDPLHPSVRRAVEVLADRQEKLAAAPQNMAEFWNVCTRPADKNGYGLEPGQAERRLRLVESQFAILAEPPSTYSLWRDLVVSHAVRGKQVHDARLVAIMQAFGISHILTLNGNDFTRYTGLTVLNPRDLSTLA